MTRVAKLLVSESRQLPGLPSVRDRNDSATGMRTALLEAGFTTPGEKVVLLAEEDFDLLTAALLALYEAPGEMGRVLAAATFLDDDAKAAERLRSQCHGIALELMNLCPSCKFDEMLIPVVQRYEAAIGDIERRMQSVSEHQVGQLLPRQRPSLVVGSSFSVTKEEPLC